MVHHAGRGSLAYTIMSSLQRIPLTYTQLPVREIRLNRLAAGTVIPGFTHLTLRHGDLVEWGDDHELRRVVLGSWHFTPAAMSLHAVSEARDYEVEIAKSVSTYYYDLDTASKAPSTVVAHLTGPTGPPATLPNHPGDMGRVWHVVRIGPIPPGASGSGPEDPRL
jgi:hypothetical protein